MIYQSTDTLDDVTGNLFSLFCSIWRTVLKMFVRLFRIKQVKASKKFSRSFLQKRKVEKRRQKDTDFLITSKSLTWLFLPIAAQMLVKFKGNL